MFGFFLSRFTPFKVVLRVFGARSGTAANLSQQALSSEVMSADSRSWCAIETLLEEVNSLCVCISVLYVQYQALCRARTK